MSFDYKTLTRREYYILKIMERPEPGNIFLAMEAVASTAIEHPEWDMTEVKSYDEWQKLHRRNKTKK